MEGQDVRVGAEYNQESALDSKMIFMPAVFYIDESGTWFFSMTWEHGRGAEPVESLDDRGAPKP